MSVLGGDKKAVTMYLYKNQDIKLNRLSYLLQKSKSSLMRECVQYYLNNLSEETLKKLNA